MRGMGARLSFQAIAVVLLLLLAVSPIMAAYGQAAGYTDQASSKELQKLRLRAFILQKMLERAANAANTSDALRSDVEALVSINISALSEDELREFIARAEALLAEIRGCLARNATLSQDRVAMRILERVRERLNLTLAKMNLTAGEAEQVRERIREWIRERAGENLTVRDVAHLMKIIREMLRHMWAARISEEAMNYTERAARSGALFGLMNALNASSKVLAVLERVRERLMEVNASENAIEAVEHAMERIATAREVLKQLMERLSAGYPPGNATRERAREELRSILREKAEKLNETIEEYLGRLQELRDKARELNLTDLARELDEEIVGLEMLREKIASGNWSLSELAGAAASAKGLIKRAENLIEKAARKMGEAKAPIAPPKGKEEARPPIIPPGKSENRPGER
ncbi:MAG: hypothetical protein QXD26_04270 [Nitrososphaerota archaeon]